jgi:hypothetical protein
LKVGAVFGDEGAEYLLKLRRRSIATRAPKTRYDHVTACLFHLK